MDENEITFRTNRLLQSKRILVDIFICKVSKFAVNPVHCNIDRFSFFFFNFTRAAARTATFGLGRLRFLGDALHVGSLAHQPAHLGEIAALDADDFYALKDAVVDFLPRRIRQALEAVLAEETAPAG